VKVIEYLEGYYTAQEEPFGVAYKWYQNVSLLSANAGQDRPSLPSRASAADAV